MAITPYQRKLLQDPKYNGYGGVTRASKELGIPYSDAYFELRIKPKGYETQAEYQHAIWQKHGKQKKYRQLSIIIRKCLKKLKKNQNWLAKAINESRQIISNYVNGKTLPEKIGVMHKIEKALDLKPNSLEEIVRRNKPL